MSPSCERVHEHFVFAKYDLYFLGHGNLYIIYFTGYMHNLLTVSIDYVEENK